MGSRSASFLLDDAGEATALIVAGAIATGCRSGTSDAAWVHRSSLAQWFDRVAPSAPVVVEEKAVARGRRAFGVGYLAEHRRRRRQRAGESGLTRRRWRAAVDCRDAARRTPGRVAGWTHDLVPALPGERLPNTSISTPDERPALARRGIGLAALSYARPSRSCAGAARGVKRRPGIRAWTRRQIARVPTPVDATAAGVTSAC